MPRPRRPAGSNAAEATARAYARLRGLIVEGVLTPGAPLVETDLGARLAVSRTPVRAALLRLEQEGLVRRVATLNGRRADGAARAGRTGRAAGRAGVAAISRRPATGGGRAVVAPLTADDLREIFLMVGALEATAVRQAATLDAKRRETLAVQLAEANAGLRAAIARRPPDLVAGQEAHALFHRALVAAGAGPRLRAEIEVLAAQAERYQRVYNATMMYACEEFAGAHDAVIAAIRAGDANAAERAVGADWRITARRHGEMLAILGERGNW